jgi:hypothetical protein
MVTVRLHVALTLAALLIGACRPAYELDLAAGRWEVSSIGQATIPDDLRSIIQFDVPDVDHVTVETACRQFVLVYALESDSDAISFERVGEPLECAERAAKADAALVRALGSVETWRVVDQRSVELHGDETIVLELES